MKNTALAIAAIIIAVCIGFGIPLASAKIQDNALLNGTESLNKAEATLGLNGRGSISLAQKFVLVGINDGIYSADLSEGKYMLASQAAEKAREYAEMLERFGIRCVHLQSAEYLEEAPQPKLVVDDSGELPSIIVWSVTIYDENGSMTFTIDDETGTLLALTYYANDYTGWTEAQPVQPDIALLRDIADTFAALIGANINSVSPAENIRPYYTDYIFINAVFADGQEIGGESDDDKMSNALLLRICDKGYSFNHEMYG